MADALLFGYNIELDGIGTFGLSLKCRPVMEEKEIRAESIHFNDVTFRSSAKLRNRLKAMPVVRAEEKERKPLDSELSEARVMEYLRTHPYITGREYAALCHCGKTKAAAGLKRLQEENKLVRNRIGTTFLYSAADTN